MFLFLLLVHTAPKPDHWAMGCYVAVGKSCTRDSFSTLEEVLAKYECDYCPLALEQRLDWVCASHSETLELHPGYLDFATCFDMLVSHAFHVTKNMKFVDVHVLKNGVTLKDFIVTDNGFLAVVPGIWGSVRIPDRCSPL